MEHDIPDPKFDRVATFDIETTHYDAEQGEVISVGIGVHDRGEPADNADYEMFHREEPSVGDELDVIRRAVSYLDTCDADGLVTYNGVDFDLPFLVDRMYINGAERPVIPLNTDETHVDLLKVRKQRCNRTGEDWPSLEGCLEAYGLPVPTTIWKGEEMDNVRFGEELGPEYLLSFEGPVSGSPGQLRRVINHYLRTDLEANITLFYSDIGVAFEPSLLDSHEEF